MDRFSHSSGWNDSFTSTQVRGRNSAGSGLYSPRITMEPHYNEQIQ